MAICSNCGKNLREDAVFCTGCGASVNNPSASRQNTQNNYNPGSDGMVTNVPLIALAPVEKFYSKKNLKKAGIAVGTITGIVLVIMGVLLVMALLQNNPGVMGSKFEETDVSNKVYSDCLALVADVRNDNIDALLKDIINDEGLAEDYAFINTYEKLFKEARGENPTELEVMFSQCSFLVAYTEFTARKFEYYRDNMVFGSTVADDADKFRQHADYLYETLVKAETEVELQVIIDYCADNKIMTIKK